MPRRAIIGRRAQEKGKASLPTSAGVPWARASSIKNRPRSFLTTFSFPKHLAIGAQGSEVGWDQGLLGLCVGAKATLVIPPAMGYGDQGAGGDIPGGATLNFDVEVVSSSPAPPPPNLFKEIDANEDGQLALEEVEAFFKGKGNPVRFSSLASRK